MPNVILTPTAVTREALRVLHQKLTFIGSINRQYDSSFAQSGAKIGTDLKIRLPNEYVVRTGATLNAQDTSEISTTLTVNSQKGVDLNFTAAELTMSLDDFSDRVIEPAMAVLSAAMESDALNMIKDVNYQVNNIGSAATMKKLLDTRKRLVDSLCPEGKRTALLCTQDNVDLIDSIKTLFNDQSSIAKQYRDGMMGHAVGFDFGETTHLTQQLRGSANAAYVVGTTPTVQGTNQLPVVTGAGTIKRGDVFTVAGCYEVHPETKISTGRLMQFTNMIDSAGGAVTLTVSPAMYTGVAPVAGRQNIDVFPTSGQLLVFQGTLSVPYGMSICYHRDAFAFASADLIMPKGVDWGAREHYDGISMRIVRQYDITNDKFPCRLDVLYGYKTIRPQLAARFANN